MSDSVQMTLIIAVTVVIVLLLFRKRLGAFLFKAGSEGVEAELKTQESSTAAKSADGGVSVTGARMRGSKQEISIRGDNVEVRDTRQSGKDQSISVDTRDEASSGD